MNFEQITHAGGIGQLIAGLLLLLFGRKLFWLFVGCIGFLAGFQLAGRVLTGQPELIILLAAVVVGIVGAVLALVLQRLMAAIAGGLAGGLIAIELAKILGFGAEPGIWIAFLVGAIFAAILVSALFDWALIILSSLSGALALTALITVNNQLLSMLIAAVLAIGGIVFQSRILPRPRPASPG